MLPVNGTHLVAAALRRHDLHLLHLRNSARPGAVACASCQRKRLVTHRLHELSGVKRHLWLALHSIARLTRRGWSAENVPTRTFKLRWNSTSVRTTQANDGDVIAATSHDRLKKERVNLITPRSSNSSCRAEAATKRFRQELTLNAGRFLGSCEHRHASACITCRILLGTPCSFTQFKAKRNIGGICSHRSFLR